ncbi:hypothetical protein [Deinococcus soli (ex Cha et al. 2016)]|uniref:Uncharacterized protein n=2 Tax=Deinococcus soli (ex Cha et al. 2016) TaxID=1309411 RepID=A0ACC6KL41_9DEIO|nr:hypothetical protein [Deinococcus soli (ex Cha et al. 2016)]MDR6218753.1 hypothetical protein [Deinococcus soli (ex Cha et al. 2016)]MDR6328550.1 hypothetical protein [Deinococcus soli (ex Cha et al. 2016)]MDR6753161.1 hypothetical protein [Deinococcus soli (ex Cha et al. 2016)]
MSMNVYDHRWALIRVMEALPQQDCWPAHFLERANNCGSVTYCWPCLKRILKRLGDDPEDRGWRWGQDNEAAVPEDCHYCGRPLQQTLCDDGITYELDHFESLSDADLTRSEPHEIARLLAQADRDAVSVRAFTTVERFLTLRGVPLPGRAGSGA